MSGTRVSVFNPKWADERKWCRYARENDLEGASTCPNIVNRPNERPWCALNGKERKSRCVFDEPNCAPIWIRIQESVEEYRRKGWV